MTDGVAGRTRDVVLGGRPTLAGWMREYASIEREHAQAFADLGVRLVDRKPYDRQAAVLRERLERTGAIMRNGGASVVGGSNDISPACVACTGSACSQTFFLSLACNRHCYFCFNRNQTGYDQACALKENWREELDAFLDAHPHVSCIGLTGGEPLLHEDETVAFLAYARARAPQVHLRLYTAGDFLDDRVLARLRDAGLDELRLSVKLDVGDMDGVRGTGGANGANGASGEARTCAEGCAHAEDRVIGEDALDFAHTAEDDVSAECAGEVVREALRRLERAQRYIEQVMVEMPVIPGTGAPMRELLRGLDRIGAFGINLLEFGYPMNEWDEFARRGFSVLNPPYAVPYDYTYAGGLPVAGSELLCLELLEFAQQSGLSISVHYCSLENKNRSQIRQQNEACALDTRLWELDANDFFWKAAKAFDEDAPVVRAWLERAGAAYEWDRQERSVLFHVRYIAEVAALRVSDARDGDNVAAVTSFNVIEPREGGFVVRELALKLQG